VGKGKMGVRFLGAIREAFEESNLPYRVDVLDWFALTPEFQAIIEQGYEVIYSPQKNGDNAWSHVRLGDVVRTNASLYSEKESWQSVKYLDTGSISENKIEQIQTIDLKKEKLPSRAKRKVNKNDIVYSTVRPIQRHYGILKNIPENFLVSTGFTTISATEKTDSAFIYYYLTQKEIVEYLQTLAEQTVSTYPSIKSSDIENLQVNLPPLPTQRAIAATLSCLDDKIDLNNRINANLEAQAQAIFKSWFVDFEPFKDGEFVDSELGKIPKGWRVGKLSDLVNIKYGKAHQSLNAGEFPVYGSGGLMRYAEKYLYDKESVLIPRKGTLNNSMYITEPFWTVDTMFFTEMKIQNISTYIYQFIKRKDLASMNAGTAVPSMTTEILNALNILIPPHNVLQKFSDIVSTLYDKQKANQKKSRTLAAIRDTLLPKLMSGELEVEND
jgi:type I restriction enzyme S subunit